MTPRLRELLAVTLRTSALSGVRELWEIRETWARAIGERIARHATPVALSRRELLISVPEPVWRQELALLTPELIRALNGALGQVVVERIRLIGASSAAELEPRMYRRLSATTEALARTAPPANAIGDLGAPTPTGADIALPKEVATALERLSRARRGRIEHDATDDDRLRRRKRY